MSLVLLLQSRARELASGLIAAAATRTTKRQTTELMCILFPDKPPLSVKSRGARGAQQQAMLDKQNNPNVFALGLKDAAW